MAWSNTGALYGSVVPGMGTLAGGLLGGLGKKGGAPFQSGMVDETKYATEDFREMFGRDPESWELAQLVPAYVGADQRIPNKAQGRAMVAQYFQSQENTPDKQYARQQAAWAEKAPQFYGTIDQMFQSSLGRAATEAERKHFGSLLASGQLDEYGVGQFVQSLPEYTQKQDAQFRQGLSGELQQQDARYYNEQIMPGIQSAFAQQGRDPRSSAFANSLALAAQGQNRQRESFLSNLTAQQYMGNRANARQDYLNRYGEMQGLQDFSRQRSAQLQDQTTGRVNELQNYAIQRQTYDDYLRRYGKRSSGIGSLIGGLAGIGLGAYFGGPAGAKAGGMAGSYIGDYI